MTGAISQYDLASTSWRGDYSPAVFAISAVWGRLCAYHLDKKHSKRDSRRASVSLRRVGYANYRRCDCSPRYRYSAVGKLLSGSLSSVLGIGFLFFREQLCDCWIWGCNASVEGALVGPFRKHGRLADIRSLHWTSVRCRHSSGRWRFAISTASSLRGCDCGSGRLPSKAKLLFR